MQVFHQIKRNLHKIEITKLLYKKYGKPSQVLEQLKENLEYEISPKEVVVKMLAAPVNPQDMNIIEGKYPNRPALPSIPGNEGVGVIQQVGAEVTDLEVGDCVVPLKSHLGTWRSHFISCPAHLLKVPKDLGLVESATLTINPCTAYRLLHDFRAPRPGDTLVQNGANSAVGQNVIQIAKYLQVKTINIIRHRDGIDDLKTYLKQLGADYVYTEDEIKDLKLEIKKPTLGLNCIGGKSVLKVIRLLDKNSTLVTYGGMAREPVIIPTGPFIFRKLKAVGFWLNEWLDDPNNTGKRQQMYDDIIAMMLSGELKGPNSRIIPFNQYKEAVTEAYNDRGMVGRKYILDFIE